MNRLLSLIILCIAFLAPAAFGAEPPGAAAEKEGIPQSAVVVTHIGPLPITNSMIVTWIVAIGVIVFAQIATRNIKQVPEGAQNFWEWLVESLYNFLQGII